MIWGEISLVEVNVFDNFLTMHGCNFIIYYMFLYFMLLISHGSIIVNCIILRYVFSIVDTYYFVLMNIYLFKFHPCIVNKKKTDELVLNLWTIPRNDNKSYDFSVCCRNKFNTNFWKRQIEYIVGYRRDYKKMTLLRYQSCFKF